MLGHQQQQHQQIANEDIKLDGFAGSNAADDHSEYLSGEGSMSSRSQAAMQQLQDTFNTFIPGMTGQSPGPGFLQPPISSDHGRPHPPFSLEGVQGKTDVHHHPVIRKVSIIASLFWVISFGIPSRFFVLFFVMCKVLVTMVEHQRHLMGHRSQSFLLVEPRYTRTASLIGSPRIFLSVWVSMPRGAFVQHNLTRTNFQERNNSYAALLWGWLTCLKSFGGCYFAGWVLFTRLIKIQVMYNTWVTKL